MFKIFLIFLLFLYPLFSEKSNENEKEKPKGVDKYEGDISYKDKRILDYKTEGSIPNEMKLFYRGKEGDYIVFYDLDGQEILYKYRRNKFDLDAEIKLSGLHPGQTYRIKGRFRGLFLYFDPIEKKNFFPPKFIFSKDLKKEYLKDPNNKPAFILESYETTALDEVIY